MTDKIEPYLPFYSKPPNVVLKKWTEPFEDRNGNHGILTKVLFKDKKNKEHETIASVKWLYIAPATVYPRIAAADAPVKRKPPRRWKLKNPKQRRVFLIGQQGKKLPPMWLLKRNAINLTKILSWKNYTHLPAGEFNRMVKHPRIWRASEYWILNGGTNRKLQLRLHLFGSAVYRNKYALAKLILEAQRAR